MFQKLDDVEKRYDELTAQISDPEVIARTSEWQKLMKNIENTKKHKQIIKKH